MPVICRLPQGGKIEGDAVSSDIRLNKTATTPLGVIQGSLDLTNLTSGNLRAGVTIDGVTGDSNVVNTSNGDAVESDILSGKKAYVDGALVTGSYVPPALTPGTNVVGTSGGGTYHGYQMEGWSEAYAKKLSEVRILVGGTLRFSFDLYNTYATMPVWARLYKNGVAVGTARNSTTQTPTTFTEDLSVNAGDLISIMAWETLGNSSDVKVENVKISINNIAEDTLGGYVY